MTISVVIPTYNRLPFLLTALASVFAQSHLPDEVIVIDDGSQYTKLSMQALQSTAPIPLTYVSVPHCGKPSRLRNRGCELAQGDLIAFLDDDDIWLPRKLERHHALHSATHVRFSHSREIWVRNGCPISQPPAMHQRSGDLFLSTLHKCIIGPSTMVMERTLFQELGGFNETLEIAEDYEFSIRASLRCSIYYIDEPLIFKIGGHASQLSERYEYIELFRIEALRHVLATVPLTHFQRKSIQDSLVDKYHIWAQGCEKRGKTHEARHYRRLARQIHR